MKLGTVFIIGSSLLFAAALAEAQPQDHRRDAKEDRRQNHSSRHDARRGDVVRGGVTNRHHDRRHDRRHEYRHEKRKRVVRRSGSHHRDAFVGGLVLGGIAVHALTHNDYCPTHGVRHHHQSTTFRSNRYGECFRVEHRRRGDVYVEVPRHQCF